MRAQTWLLRQRPPVSNQKFPMCEAQVDHVSCISQSALSHSLNVAAQKVSEVPIVPCVQAKMNGTDNVMDMCESTNLAAEEETTSIEDNVMDMCESTNLAAEAETTSIKPKMPVCEAQVDRVSCISQSALSHSLNVAAQKVSEVPIVPCVQAKMNGTDNVMDMCESTNLAAEEETTSIEDNVMDMCESTNLAAEAETTSIKPKMPVCEAQVDRVSCISQSALSHSLNVAAQKVSEVPIVPCVQAKMDGTDSELAITGVYTDNSHFKYNPVDVEWQLRVCRLLGLGFCGPNRITPGSLNAPLANPVGFKNIRGDGNCMFQSLSFIITGSEDQHMHVRRAIIRHMRDIGNVL